MQSQVKKLNPLQDLATHGQSVWFDYIRRSLLTSGELKKLIADDGLMGMTSNPSIFEKAIAGSTDYKDSILEARQAKMTDANAVYEKLAVKDIQDATTIFEAVYNKTNKRDGYVSLEVSPLLASDTKQTLDEARRLWKAVNRPNLMIKVPGTPEGIPAFKQLIAEGTNVNVTLLFSQEAYEKVAVSYIEALEERASKNLELGSLASVASFFVSRIDSMIDALLLEKANAAKTPEEKEKFLALQGKVAIANAKQAYKIYERLFSGPRWQKLKDKGAQPQRLLWASTSTKDPKFRDVLYVEELIGKDTVNTVPPATFDAFREHGRLRDSLTENVPAADKVMADLAQSGISMTDVTNKLLSQGVDLFADAFKKLIAAVEKEIAPKNETASKAIDRLTYKLPKDLEQKVKDTLAAWQKDGKLSKLWAGDTKVWTGADENKWLGWLNVTENQIAQLDQFKKLAQEVKQGGFSQVCLLGMGGSSLCPEVMQVTFGTIAGYPELFILDSTDPAQIQALADKLDIAKTIFVVSSKSGSTLEPNIFKQFFFDKVTKKLGEGKAGDHFIAITDPGSKMEAVAKNDKFRHIFYGVPSIGGRYSALSNFGVIPSAIKGIDIEKFLEHTEEMVQACGATVQANENPGAILGTIMGVCGNAGMDKVTIITSPGIANLGAWLEQLIAESTGKLGKGLVPVDREALADPTVYGGDRLFVYLKLEGDSDAKQQAAIEKLEQADKPVVRITLKDIYQIGQEFFRWEIATAIAGSILGINPFDQPDVEASKVVTRDLTNEYEKNGSLPKEEAFFEEGGIKLFADNKNRDELVKATSDKSLAGYLKTHLNRSKAGDYFALLAYLQMSADNQNLLQTLRHSVRDKKKIATCMGFGPRFLHSTGQAYKGGPNSGVFLQITGDDAVDVPVPGQKYTFSVVKAAQARGDFQVLADRGRRALRIHLSKDTAKSLAALKSAFEKALA